MYLVGPRGLGRIYLERVGRRLYKNGRSFLPAIPTPRHASFEDTVTIPSVSEITELNEKLQEIHENTLGTNLTQAEGFILRNWGTRHGCGLGSGQAIASVVDGGGEPST